MLKKSKFLSNWATEHLFDFTWERIKCIIQILEQMGWQCKFCKGPSISYLQIMILKNGVPTPTEIATFQSLYHSQWLIFLSKKGILNPRRSQVQEDRSQKFFIWNSTRPCLMHLYFMCSNVVTYKKTLTINI
jgi:hypothetical protein